MIHQMNLFSDSFIKIKNTDKTIELRLNDEKRSLIKIGDLIEFTNTNDNNQKVLVEVTDLYYFVDFDELYLHLPLDKCGYTKEELPIAHPDDMLSYYSLEKQTIYGVVGISLRLI